MILKKESPLQHDIHYQEAVKTWQFFLRGLHYDIVADGDFGNKTEIASKDFQQHHGLNADGIIGEQSLAKAKQLGFELDTTADSEFPPLPVHLSQPDSSRRNAFLGTFSYECTPRPNNLECIRITDNWVEKNIIKINVPQLIGITGAPHTANVYFHKKVAESVIALFNEWDKQGLTDKILAWDGSYVPRLIRGSKTVLSNHAYGSAFDINYPWNKLGSTPALVGQRGSVRELVQIANNHGFFWGGHYKNRKDGMHFEFADF
ncbi:MAG: M15 family metallopeptidase [Methylococcaceae bacterium]